MEDKDDVLVKDIKIDDKRIVHIKSIFFENGCFIIISENSNRIGSVTMAASISNKVTSAIVIPSKFDSIFIKSIAQRISLMLNGICLVSLHIKTPLDVKSMKTIMGEILNMISTRAENDTKRQF
ncbi:MAG: hypothetical protein QOK67_00495 [Nitrososphaeraceae archaeon]|jgi:hypothetical protein|nr:hypothetical protein [Nitrososphaeraceae archaeon]